MAIRSPEETYRHLKSTLENVREGKDGRSFTARCPTHDDKENSLSVSLNNDGLLLAHCFAGCETAQVLYACGVLMAECFPRGYEPDKKKDAKPEKVIVATYWYQDEDGNNLYQVVRYEPKDFRLRRLDDDGNWVYGTRGVRRVLYHLPEVIAAPRDEPVLLVEGEKDVETLRRLGFVATTNPCGANNWRDEFTAMLADKRVLVLFDNDEPGRKRAKRLVGELKKSAAFVRVLELPDLPLNGGDVTDWLDAGHTADELRELIDKALVPDAKEIGSASENGTIYEEQVLRALGLEVLGHLEGGKAKVFSIYHKRTHVIELNRLGYAGILQICGPTAKDRVVPSQTSDPGLCTVSQVRNAIALMSGFRKAEPENELGPGCWLGKDDKGHEDGSVLLVNSGGAAIWQHGKLASIDVPCYGSQVLDFTMDKPWFDYDRVEAWLAGFSHTWAKEVIEETEDILAAWRWQRQEASTRLMVGMILASWVQTIWDWRPQVALLGKSKSGKSTLLDLLRDIFGPLAIRTSNPSPPGIRQKLQYSARVPLIDEHDTNKQKSEMLEMVRASGRGDVVLRGTTGKQKGKSFLLQHIFWIAGITMLREREPDRNRFIFVELLPAPDGKEGELVLPQAEYTQELGQKLLAIAVRVAIDAKETARRLKAVKHQNVDSRVIESYAVPAAMVGHAVGASEEEIIETLKWLLPVDELLEEQTSDEIELLADIFNSQVQVPGGKRLAVTQLMARRNFETDYEDILEAVGIKMTELEAGRGRPRGDRSLDAVFIDPKKVRQLLRGTQWADQNIKDILKRIPDVRVCRKVLAYGRPQGFAVPVSMLDEAGVWDRGEEGDGQADDLDALF